MQKPQRHFGLESWDYRPKNVKSAGIDAELMKTAEASFNRIFNRILIKDA